MEQGRSTGWRGFQGKIIQMILLSGQEKLFSIKIYEEPVLAAKEHKEHRDISEQFFLSSLRSFAAINHYLLDTKHYSPKPKA